MEKGVRLTSLNTSREGSEQTPAALTPIEGCTCQQWHKRKDLYNKVLIDGAQEYDSNSIFQEIDVTNWQNKTWSPNQTASREGTSNRDPK